jgi:hypothetical protein
MTDLRLVVSNQLPSLTISTRPKPPSISTNSPAISPTPSPPGFEPLQKLFLHANLNRLLTLQPECEPQIARTISRMLDAAERIAAEHNDAQGQAKADREVLLSRR